jgi:hypothetical protein
MWGASIEDRRLFTARRYAVSAGGPFMTALIDSMVSNEQK